MNKRHTIVILAVFCIGFLAGCSRSNTNKAVCLDSIEKVYVIDQIDQYQVFGLAQYKGDVRLTTLDGDEIELHVEVKDDKEVIAAPKGGYQKDMIYVLELNDSRLEDESFKDARKLYFSVDPIENKEMEVTNCIMDDCILTNNGKSYIQDLTFVFANPELKIDKEVDQFSAIEIKIDGDTYTYEDGILPVQPKDGTHTIEFILEYGNQHFEYGCNQNFKTATLLDLYGQQELLDIGKTMFAENYAKLYGLVYGAIFDVDTSEVIDVKGQPFALAADTDIQTSEGFENYYYSIYSRKYPMVDIRMHKKNGKVYFPVASGIGGPLIRSIEVRDVQKASEDEVWYTVYAEDLFGGSKDYVYSLVFEDDKWKFGVIDIPFMTYVEYN